MNQNNQDNTVATTSSSPKTDALVQAAVNDATGSNNSITFLFWFIVIAFAVALFLIRKNHLSKIATVQPVEHSPLTTFALSESLSLSRHQKSGDE